VNQCHPFRELDSIPFLASPYPRNLGEVLFPQLGITRVNTQGLFSRPENECFSSSPRPPAPRGAGVFPFANFSRNIFCRSYSSFLPNAGLSQSSWANREGFIGAMTGDQAWRWSLQSIVSPSPSFFDVSIERLPERVCIEQVLEEIRIPHPALYSELSQIYRDALRADHDHSGVVNNQEARSFGVYRQREENNRPFSWNNLPEIRLQWRAVLHWLPLALQQAPLNAAEVRRVWLVLNHYAQRWRELQPDRTDVSLYGLSLQDFPSEQEPNLVRRIREGNLSLQEWAAVHALLEVGVSEETELHFSARGLAPFLPEEIESLRHFLEEAGRRGESLFGLRILADRGGNISCPERNLNYCEDERRFINQRRMSEQVRASYLPGVLATGVQASLGLSIQAMLPFERANDRDLSASWLIDRAIKGELDPQEVRLLRTWMRQKAIEEGTFIEGDLSEQLLVGGIHGFQGMVSLEFYLRMLIVLPQHFYLYQQTVERWHFNSQMQHLCGPNSPANAELAFQAYEKGMAEYAKNHAWVPWAHHLVTFVELLAFNLWIGPWKDTGNPGIDILSDVAFLPFFRWLSHVNMQWTQLPRMIREHPEICQGEYHEAPETESERSESSARNASALMNEVLASGVNAPVQTLPDSAIRNPYLHSAETGVLNFLFPPVFSPAPNSIGVPSGTLVFGR